MDERRYCSRFKMPDPVPATLRLEERDVPVLLIDQSANGFQVSMAGSHRFPIGKWMLLHVNGVWTEVCVARLERRLGETRLGLQRDRDLANEDDFKEFKPSLRSYFPRLPQTKVAMGLGAAGFGCILLFGMGLWLLQSFIGQLQQRPFVVRETLPGSAQSEMAPKVFNTVLNSEAGRRSSPTKKSPETSFSKAARAIFGLRLFSGDHREQTVLDNLELVAAALDSQVVDELQMTRNQMETIQDLVEQGRDDLASRMSMSQANLDEQAVAQARQLHDQVRSVLNSQQQRRLESLLQSARQ